MQARYFDYGAQLCIIILSSTSINILSTQTHLYVLNSIPCQFVENTRREESLLSDYLWVKLPN